MPHHITTQPKYLDQIEAMRKVAEALAGLSSEDCTVVLQWATSQFLRGTSQVLPTGNAASNIGVADGGRDIASPVVDEPRFNSLGDLVAAASPGSGPERALVVGYWFQVINKQDTIEAADVNSELTHLGHRLANVTTTMSLLMNQRPALVIQVRKTGTTRQARKRYRLTDAGIKRVEELLKREAP